MKPFLKNDGSVFQKQVVVLERTIPCLDENWHYHPEYELIFITKSKGIRFVGDSVSQFNPGDLVIVGPYLPHLWRNDDAHSNVDVKTYVIKFDKNFLGENTFDKPVFSRINDLLKKSSKGVIFSETITKKLKNLIFKLADFTEDLQHVKLLEILNTLSKDEESHQLSISNMSFEDDVNSNRMDKVLNYISENYSTKITLDDISKVACMTTNSFCRYFKNKTNKSFVQFLNEVRIRNAVRMLTMEKMRISEVCFAVGYNSKANFNVQFKSFMNCSAKDYINNIRNTSDETID